MLGVPLIRLLVRHLLECTVHLEHQPHLEVGVILAIIAWVAQQIRSLALQQQVHIAVGDALAQLVPCAQLGFIAQVDLQTKLHVQDRPQQDSFVRCPHHQQQGVYVLQDFTVLVAIVQVLHAMQHLDHTVQQELPCQVVLFPALQDIIALVVLQTKLLALLCQVLTVQ